MGSTVSMVTELCNNDLFEEISSSKNGRLSEERAAQITYALSNALNYLHHHGVVHRDLKLENILIGRDGNIKVTDFGLAKWQSIRHRNDKNDRSKMLTICGTPQYVAPEVIEENGYDNKCDCWSLGVVLYVMLCGYLPFDDDTNFGTYESIKAANYSIDGREWDDISDDAKDLISKLLKKNPRKRYDAKLVKWHPWIFKYVQE